MRGIHGNSGWGLGDEPPAEEPTSAHYEAGGYSGRRRSRDTSSEGDQILLPAGDYADYLAVRAAEIASRRTEVRSRRWRATLTGIVGLLALIGYSDLRSVTKATVGTAVADYFEDNRNVLVGEAFGEVLQEIDSKIAFVQLSTLAADIWKRRTGFTNAERDAANALLREVLLSDTVTSKPQFTAAVYPLVASYAAADLEGYMDELEGIVGHLGVSDRNVAGVFLTHYGFRVAGSVAPSEADIEKMNRYAAAVEQHKYPELSTQWRMALAHRQAGGERSEIVESLFQDVRYLTPEEQAKFLTLLDATSELRGPEDERTGKLVRASKLFQSIRETYGEELDGLRQAANGPAESEGSVMERLQELLEGASRNAPRGLGEVN